MERKQLSDQALIAASNMAITNTAKFVKDNGRGGFVSTAEAIGEVADKFWKLNEANNKGDAKAIGDAFMNVATACIFAVSSMMVIPNGQADGESGEEANVKPVDKEVAKDLAHKKMQDRITESGLVITSDMPS